MIRDALHGDWPAIWPIFKEVVHAGDTYDHPADTDKPTCETLWITKSERTFVFECDGGILGTYYLKTNQNGPDKHVCNCGYMVSSDARGVGIARRMCQHSQGIAVAMGFNALKFNFVASSNDTAVALRKKLGFDVVGTLPRAFNHPTLELVDAFVMYKWLTD